MKKNCDLIPKDMPMGNVEEEMAIVFQEKAAPKKPDVWGGGC